MSEAKHTPGPWRIGKNYGAVVADHPVPELRGSDDVNAYGGHLIAESIALQNRPLIAAAPELLEALQELLTDMVVAQGNMLSAAKRDSSWEGCAETIQPRIDAARAAIAKATGQPHE